MSYECSIADGPGKNLNLPLNECQTTQVRRELQRTFRIAGGDGWGVTEARVCVWVDAIAALVKGIWTVDPDAQQ